MTGQVALRRPYASALTPYAARAAWNLGQYAGKKIANYIRSRPSNRSSGKKAARRNESVANNVTFQHDYAHIYSRRRAPRRLRRRARRAAYRFNKQLTSSLGQRTWNRSAVFDSGTIVPTSLANSQSVFTVGLWGGDSTGSNTWGDLYQIASDATSGLIAKQGNIWFKAACMDVQIRNTTDSYTVAPPSPCILCVELYSVFCRRDGYFNPGDVWSNAMAQQDLLVGTGVLATPLSLNCVPFDAPGFGTEWFVSKKVRYRISPGQSVYLQMRDSKSRKFETGRFEYDSGITDTRVKFFKGWSRGYMLVIRSDLSTGGDTPAMVPFKYEILYTKNYKFVEQAYERDNQVFDP